MPDGNVAGTGIEGKEDRGLRCECPGVPSRVPPVLASLPSRCPKERASTIAGCLAGWRDAHIHVIRKGLQPVPQNSELFAEQDSRANFQRSSTIFQKRVKTTHAEGFTSRKP